MKWISQSVPLSIAVGLCLGRGSTAFADPPRGEVTHRPKIVSNFVTPQGRPVTENHDRYRYVVPPTARYGAYFNYEKEYYYAPPSKPGQNQHLPPVATKFGAAQHSAELSERIEALANELCLDLESNYRHNPGFKEIYGRANAFLTTAQFIHNKEHREDRPAIQKAVLRLDELLERIQVEVEQLQRRESRQIGQMQFFARIEELQALVHHLMYDQGLRVNHGPTDEPHGPPPDRRGPRVP